MGSSFELLALPAKIVPAARLSDDEFLAFCAANEPYQFEINEKGEILVMTPSRPKRGNLEGYVFRELDLWVDQAGRGLAVNSNTISAYQTLPCGCQMRRGFLQSCGTH